MTFSKPFYRYSPKNIYGQTPHPSVRSKREKVLNLWIAGQKTIEIADSLGISENTVKHYIRLARINGDLRAKRRTKTHFRERVQKADQRRDQIVVLYQQGFTIRQIANMCHCTRRLVELRLKEAKDGSE